jgi:DNA repair protein RadA/Sms
MILAVLEARVGISFQGLDVYLNIAGGLRITEPAADLAVAAALVSARESKLPPKDCVFFGEVSLSAALRAVPQAEIRLNEARKLGFSAAYVPSASQTRAKQDLTINKVEKLDSFIVEAFGQHED